MTRIGVCHEGIGTMPFQALAEFKGTVIEAMATLEHQVADLDARVSRLELGGTR